MTDQTESKRKELEEEILKAQRENAPNAYQVVFALEYLSTALIEAREQLRIAKNRLEELAKLGNGDRYGNSVGNEMAQKALKELEANH